MLRFLSIDDFTLIDRLEVEFSDGLNLITGETGSGKSILVDAVGLLLGQRASSEQIRSGSAGARVEGIFQVGGTHPARPCLEEAGIQVEGDQLIVRREISREGTNKVFLNGVLSTQSLLAEVGAQLADIHGQHDQQVLLHPAAHLHYLDRFGDYRDTLTAVAEISRQLRESTRQVESIQAREQERLRQIDQLQYQIADIDKLQLRPGLDRELEEERDLLASSEKRHEASQAAYQLLYEDEPSALGLLDRARRAVEESTPFDPRFEEFGRRLAEARFSLEEAAFDLRAYADRVESDPSRLEAVQGRLAEIQLARRKYGETVDAILEFRRHAESERDELQAEETRLEGLEKQRRQREAQYQEAARALTEKRQEAARRLSTQVERQLSELAMEKTVFRVSFAPLGEPFSEKGNERVEFLISANPGEPPRPLAKIASGGELSRILLALKSILNPDRHFKTLVFDEVDAGIGGRVASVLGDKLARLARHHQVFCVTHLPQIAAAAARHFHVEKVSQGRRTRVQLRLLTVEQREEELARMLAGREVTATTLRQAREMLARSSRNQPSPANDP